MSSIPTPEETLQATYASMGMRAGLEIHQQLDTQTKLFCRCPAGLYSSEYDAEILRHMRPTLSELGEYDRTALMEFKTRKEIIYRLKRESVCTYEMDDTPPFEINDQALDIAIELALLLELNVVGEIHIARKQYLDGSIPTGFQRTTILGVDGSIPYKERRIGIQQLGLEEDSCREVSDIGHVRTFMTDRLAMPLIEVVTTPDMTTPAEVADVAQLIRRLTRSTGKVRTGAGAARQDVNVSITGGTRVEIKGVPRIAWIPKLVHYEAFRQAALLDIVTRLKGRGLVEKEWKASSFDVTRIVRRTSFTPVSSVLKMGAKAIVIRLPGFRGILDHPTAPGRNFGSEVRDRVRIIACLDREPVIMWPSMEGPGFPIHLWNRIRNVTGAEEGDEVVLVYGPEDDVKTGVAEAEARCREAFSGVQPETRQVLPDCITGFERLLPGPDRMYPDTDLPPIAISEERIERVRAQMVEQVWEVADRYQKMGLGEELAWQLASASLTRRQLFEELAALDFCSESLAAAIVMQWVAPPKQRGLTLSEGIGTEILTEIVRSNHEGVITREVIPDILEWLTVHGPDGQLDEALVSLGIGPERGLSDGSSARSYVEKLIAQAEADGYGPKDPTARQRFLMGLVMGKGTGGPKASDGGGLRGKVAGRDVARLVRKSSKRIAGLTPERTEQPEHHNVAMAEGEGENA